jgi:branched-chain amino acid transport system permease protein
MLAVALSSAMTAVSGVFFAFYYNNLFPEQIFNISRSIELILGPVIGGVGTLFGPILGAAVLTLLSDGITEALAALGWEIPGIKQVFYGVVLLAVVMFLPNGIWPALARRLGFAR